MCAILWYNSGMGRSFLFQKGCSMKPITVDRYYTWYGSGVIGHNAYHNGVRIISIVKRSTDYRIQLYNGAYVCIAPQDIITVSNNNTFIVK